MAQALLNGGTTLTQTLRQALLCGQCLLVNEVLKGNLAMIKTGSLMAALFALVGCTPDGAIEGPSGKGDNKAGGQCDAYSLAAHWPGGYDDRTVDHLPKVTQPDGWNTVRFQGEAGKVELSAVHNATLDRPLHMLIHQNGEYLRLHVYNDGDKVQINRWVDAWYIGPWNAEQFKTYPAYYGTWTDYTAQFNNIFDADPGAVLPHFMWNDSRGKKPLQQATFSPIDCVPEPDRECTYNVDCWLKYGWGDHPDPQLQLRHRHVRGERRGPQRVHLG